MHLTGVQALSVALSVVFAVVGIGLFLWIRIKPDNRPLRLAGVGRLSLPTHVVLALACIGVAYHLAAHPLGWTGLRAPLWIAIVVAVAASLGSIAIDAMQQRADAKEREQGP
ncbi:MAG: hypothetical protein EA376_09130 [Phycisphaeraceae bacterium]|nr:MAG: hypothetical protein EA376_09130 [Phycisphaeraceae bacterium]